MGSIVLIWDDALLNYLADIHYQSKIYVPMYCKILFLSNAEVPY